MNRNNFFWALILVIVGLMVKIFSKGEIATFTPLFAIMVFGAKTLKNNYTGIILPILVLIISEMLLPGYDLKSMSLNYFVYAIILFIAYNNKSFSFGSNITLGFFGATLFFLVSNFGSMLFWNMYPHNIQGLMQSYVAGFPFYVKHLLGTLVYTTIFYYGYEYTTQKIIVFAKTK